MILMKHAEGSFLQGFGLLCCRMPTGSTVSAAHCGVMLLSHLLGQCWLWKSAIRLTAALGTRRAGMLVVGREGWMVPHVDMYRGVVPAFVFCTAH